MPSLREEPAQRAAPAAPARASQGVAITAAVLLIVGLAAAVSIDVVRAGYGVKSDEATYVAMALSLAHDGDLSYERRDLERFWGIYKQGPEGIFLKRGKNFRIDVTASAPFVRILNATPERRSDRLFYAKSIVYAVTAAPFVWLLGMNGFLVFHVLLLGAVCASGYFFLSATSRAAPALAYTLSFVGASVVPVYAVLLMPELFNFALVFLGYFFWLYKEVASPRFTWCRGVRADVIAAVLIGLATYSKPTNLALGAPLVLLWWWRRAFVPGFGVGTVFASTIAGMFLVNALITGEFNYQGGDRSTFYGRQPDGRGGFPFDGGTPSAWDQRNLVTTNDSDAANVLDPSVFSGRFANNVKYFFLGRHFGLVPYFFPGVVAVVAWAFSRERFTVWRVLCLIGAFGTGLLLLLFLPYTWSGGGGPPGNRYFLSAYPALFFVMPPMHSAWPALIAWIGGALFTAKILVNPFVAAKNTWEIAERGFARRLPVELTMAPDLPVMLDTSIRGRVAYGSPRAYLYFLDRHAFPPEPDGMWISGSGRAEIIVRYDHPIDHLEVTAFSPIRTVFTISAGADNRTMTIEAGERVAFDLPVDGVRELHGYAYLLEARSTAGFTPRLMDPSSRDDRNLGVQMNFTIVERPR